MTWAFPWGSISALCGCYQTFPRFFRKVFEMVGKGCVACMRNPSVSTCHASSLFGVWRGEEYLHAIFSVTAVPLISGRAGAWRGLLAHPPVLYAHVSVSFHVLNAQQALVAIQDVVCATDGVKVLCTTFPYVIIAARCLCSLVSSAVRLSIPLGEADC